MIFRRQKLLLGLLDALGGEVERVDFQKLLFLYTREVETEPSFDFVPYKFGGFSFTSYADRRKLTELGYLDSETKAWKLRKKAPDLDAPTRKNVAEFVKHRGKLRGKELVRLVYSSYPQTAWRSEILEEVLPDAAARRRVRSARPHTATAGLVTIGYEGRSLENYLNALLDDGVTILCDVRRNPLSRKYGFSKRALENACTAIGIRYEHLPELGIPSDKRRELNSQADYDALFDDYEAHDLPGQGEAVSVIADWVRDGERVALTCYEHLPHQCHRHCVAEAVEVELGVCDLQHL